MAGPVAALEAAPAARALNQYAGFTLIEILVVLAIVGVMILAVGLSVDSGGPARRVAVEAQRLVALMRLACDESAQFGQDVGVRFEPQGYRFVRAVGREWQPRASDALRARRLPDGMKLSVSIGERPIDLQAEGDSATAGGASAVAAARDSENSPSRRPHLACDADGALTAADPRIVIEAGERSAVVSVGDDGALRVANTEQAK